ncbi:MAG: hypothetical protein CMM00_05350 [Rhodopirellula sp.]|uniref:hypothetical protein n=1 Tax=Rhodopirellula TaxID=265488 RepID=UPI00056D1EC3|nr:MULTISPECIES: hypothetical protein [Rhodopirellula]MAP08259.1 hypothetical protein [Rhodopirellula sp.]|tara:strand:+ start:214 stop:606 length:393 start_codon:yes stop_codon:yes gene_type:complete
MNKNSRTQIILGIEEFEKVLDQQQSLCEDWLRFNACSNQIAAIFNEVTNTTYLIAEYSEKPDTFEWESLPIEFSKRCDAAIKRQVFTTLLTLAVHDAAVILKEKEREADNLIARAYHFGQTARQHHLPLG